MDYAKIRRAICTALKQLKLAIPRTINVEPIKWIEFGDLATNVAMGLARKLKQNPVVLATQIATQIAQNEPRLFAKVEAVKPGFINFFIHPQMYGAIIRPFLGGKYQPRMLPKNQRKKINLESVSANPTGQLHLGHVRNGFIVHALTNALRAVGHHVTTEYWLNDMGNQIDLFVLSTLIRYLELFGIKHELPADGYHGADPKTLAKQIKAEYADQFCRVKIDQQTNKISDPKVAHKLWTICIGAMVKQIKAQLASIGIHIDVWTSEDWVYHSGIIEKILAKGKKLNKTYQHDDALWMKTKATGWDDKDRVLIKSDGTKTYFLTDIGNQYNKMRRGFNVLLHVWGADHEGHVRRMKAIMPLLGGRSTQMQIILIQMVKIQQGGQEVKLSKRAGTQVTIPDLLKMMSADNARWHILAQANKTAISLDLEQVQRQDSTNPVYYVQYAHARLHSLLTSVTLTNKQPPRSFTLLSTPQDRELINSLLVLEPLVYGIVRSYEAHRLISYLHNVAKLFHAWYETHNLKKTVDEEAKRQRYWLAYAVKQAIAFGLGLLGISAPNQMELVSN